LGGFWEKHVGRVSPFSPLLHSSPWCSDCVAERSDVLVKCRFCYVWGLFCFFFVSSPFLGNEFLALKKQEVVWRREAFLAEAIALLFPAEVQSQGRGCTGSVTWAPSPCLVLLPQSLDARRGMAFLKCPAAVLKASPEHWP